MGRSQTGMTSKVGGSRRSCDGKLAKGIQGNCTFPLAAVCWSLNEYPILAILPWTHLLLNLQRII